MKNIIEGVNVLKQTPIKDYTTLSNVITWIGIGLAILAIVIMIIAKAKDKKNNLEDIKVKRFLLLYAFGIVMALFSMIHLPWFYTETGKYTYECTLEDNVLANYISGNFNIISVEDDVWTIEDKE